MTDNFIQLDKNDTLKLKIVDSEGKDTGEFLEFDLEDIELPLRYQELIEKDKKNKEWVKNQFLIIEKKEDHKGKKLLSANEEAKIRALQEFYNKQIEVYDMFLGKDGVKKMLNGGKLKWSTFEKIDAIIKRDVLPHLDIKMENLTKRVKEKYKESIDNKDTLK